MVLGVAEYFLRREVRSVLDIGCGEGAWRAELKRMRPELRYQGIDPSEYVVQRYGSRRNIRLGDFESLPDLPITGKYDLIVCADVLQYVPNPALKRGVDHIVRVLEGVIFLEAYTSGDDMEGDLSGWHHRTKAQYRRVFTGAGLIGCGLQCYLTEARSDAVSVELELV